MLDNILVFDDFIGKTYQDAIEELVTGIQVEWIYTKDSTYITHENLEKLDDSFSHLLLFEDKVESKHWPFFKPLTYQMADAVGVKMTKVPRVRLNMLLRAYPGDAEHTNIHVDHPNPHYVGLYYVTDSDGPTVIYNEKITDVPTKNWNDNVLTKYIKETEFTVKQIVEPKKGRLVVFDGHHFHAGTKPRNHQTRYALNINWR